MRNFGKTCSFEQKSLENLEFLTTFKCQAVKFLFYKKNYVEKFFFCHHQKMFFLKNTYKIALQFLFNVFVLFNIVFNLKFKGIEGGRPCFLQIDLIL